MGNAHQFYQPPDMTTPNTIVLWNSAGLGASADSTLQKFSCFDSQFKNANFSIAAFVETHHEVIRILRRSFLNIIRLIQLCIRLLNMRRTRGLSFLLAKSMKS